MPSWKKVIVSGSDAFLNTLTVTNGITGSLHGTSSWAENAITSSYALNAVSASHAVTASYAINADFLDGKDSSVFATTGSNIFVGNQTVTGSLFTTGSNTLIGSTTLTGSLNITGSTIQVGNNTLAGNTTLSGSIIISGAFGTNDPTVKIYGDTTHNGYIRFDPVTTNINPNISASYIYVSGSTSDLYFSQNGNGYNNTTRLRWLEGNLYTGLLNGGLITTQSSTVYQISSGSGIIVDLNASLNDNPYPTIQYLNWPNLSASIAPLTASYQQAFVSIDSAGNIYQQGTPYVSGQFNTEINIGVVLFQNQSTINGVKTQPSLAYGFEQNQNIFNRAFGPLKLSGYTLAPSGSSTGSLIVASGTAYSPGSNYPVDPNNPSYTQDSGTDVSKIFRYHQSGSTWIYNTNAGAGFTSIDPTQYSNNGVLTAVPGGGGNRQWSIQRVFWFPNSVAKAIVVYYGNATYATEVEAIANIPFESFVEAPNTAANAIYLGAIVVRNNADFTNAASYKIQPGGLFRQVGGSGGGGSIITQTLAGLSDVNISGPTDGQALVYNTTQAKWINSSAISASITGNAATATTASYALTSSNVQGGDQYYIPLWGTDTSLTSSYLYQSGSALKTIYNGIDKGLTLDYNFDSFILGNAGTGNNTYLQVFDGGSTINVYSPNYTYFNDKVGVRIIPTNPGLAVSGSLEVTGPGTTKFMNTDVQITGSLVVTDGITGSLHGTASYTLTSSNVQGGEQYYIPLWNTDTSLTSSYLYQNNDTLKTFDFGISKGLTLSFLNDEYFLGNTSSSYSGSGTWVNVNSGDGVIVLNSDNHTIVEDKLGVGMAPTNKGLAVSGSIEVTDGITGSLHGTASWAENSLQALTSSNVEGGEQYYVPLWNTDTSLTSSHIYQSGSILQTEINGVQKGLYLNYFEDDFLLGNTGSGNNTFIEVKDSLAAILVYSPLYTYFNDKVGIGVIPTNPGLTISGSLIVTGSDIVKLDANTQITGSLTVTNGITGSLHGTASWAENAISSSYAVTASYAEIFPYTGSAEITGSLLVTGSVKSTTVHSNIFINNQTITDTIYVPSGSNALIIGPVDIDEEIVVEGGGNLYITDFTNPTPNLQAVTDVGSTTTNSITAANFITTSDKRLKSEIKAIKNPFKVLDSIKSYEYIKDGKKDAGFLAQEVQETIPYAVFENEEGMLTMSDRPLLAYLYAAVMELKEENKQLRERLGVINNKL
jgi:hypothetical protein